MGLTILILDFEAVCQPWIVVRLKKQAQKRRKIQANRTASVDAYAQPTHPIKRGEKRSKIKTKRIFASHARAKFNQSIWPVFEPCIRT